ncbi:hypothetical protein FCM35_KLT15776 [Carex littledalei]|uniref:Uncharacterized protein n=1 Tax=Carex littledalei TaxID=544730 RepID=A0A833VSC3_9POAL|nr:hypothetical protein FCM35_KLT15776 [Carex littledalei]
MSPMSTPGLDEVMAFLADRGYSRAASALLDDVLSPEQMKPPNYLPLLTLAIKLEEDGYDNFTCVCVRESKRRPCADPMRAKEDRRCRPFGTVGTLLERDRCHL